MVYERINWANSPSKVSPFSADNLNRIEDGIEESTAAVRGRLADAALSATFAHLEEGVLVIGGVPVGGEGGVVGDEVVRSVIVTTGAEDRPDADVVTWIDPDELGAPNATATDLVVTPGSAGGVEAIVNAKGDLLVATGDNALDRLPVGADGYVIVADSAEPSGLRYAPQSGGDGGGGSGPTGLFPLRTGDKIRSHGVTAFYGVAGPPVGCLWGAAIFIASDCEVATLSVDVSGAGGAGESVEIVLYQMSTETLVGSFGTVAVDSSGWKGATPGSPVAVVAGWYYAAIRPRSASLTATFGAVSTVPAFGVAQQGAPWVWESPDSSITFDVSGTGPAPSSLSAYNRSLGGGFRHIAPVIVAEVA